MRKRLPTAIAAFLLLAVISYWLYPRFFTPVWTWETNLTGETYHSRLVADNGLVFRELDWPYSNDYQLGRQVARTREGFRICKVKGSADQDLLLLTGLMLPNVVFIRE